MLKKKKILIFAQALNGGGAELFLKNIIEINSKNNYQTFVCSSDNVDHLSSFFRNHNVTFYRNRILYDGNYINYLFRNKVLKLPFSNYLFWLYDILSILKVFLKTRPNFCLVSNTIQSSQFGYLLLPVPLFFFIHSVPFECSLFKKRILKILLKKFLRNKIITVSKFNGNEIEKKLGVIFSKITIIPNGIKLPKKRHLEKERENIILTVGHFESYKNVEIWYRVALTFIKKNPDFIFVWLGKGSLLNEYKTKIEKNNLSESIKILGHHNFPQEYYIKSKLYFHPSLFETQGLSIIEAMGFGLPCIASNIGGIPETISNGINGYLCEPEDISEFNKTMQLLINDEVLYRKIQKSGYETVKNKFALEKNIKSILELYKLNT